MVKDLRTRFLDYLDGNVFLQAFVGVFGFLVAVIMTVLLTSLGFTLHWFIGMIIVMLFISGWAAAIAWVVAQVF